MKKLCDLTLTPDTWYWVKTQGGLNFIGLYRNPMGDDFYRGYRFVRLNRKTVTRIYTETMVDVTELGIPDEVDPVDYISKTNPEWLV